jgi:hypothetical protein
MDQVTVTITDINQVIKINDENFVLVPKSAMERITIERKEYKAEIKELKNMVMSILSLLNLLDPDTGKIRQTVQNGDEGYLKYILKGLNKIVSLLVQAQFSKAAQKSLEETFAFIKNIIPIANKYAQTSDNKNQPVNE